MHRIQPQKLVGVTLLAVAMLAVAISGCFRSSPPGNSSTTNQGTTAGETDEEQLNGSASNLLPSGNGENSSISYGVVKFDEPAGIAYAAGKLYIADTNNHRIRVIDLANNYKTGTLEIAGLSPPPMPPEPAKVSGEEPAESAGEAEVASSEPGEEKMPEVDETDPRKVKAHPPVPEEAAEGDLAVAPDENDPFAGAVPLPFDFPDDAEWLNTSKPLKLADLKGKFVLIDFWTYCCINCIHILPELKKLERAFPNDLVVIGVHSAKFETEKGLQNIEEAILRYEIEHPVVNDPEHHIWDQFGARSWPTIVLIDPQGRVLFNRGGEIQAEPFIDALQKTVPYFHEKGLSNTTPIKFDLLKDKQNHSPLRFPGKVLADEKSNRLFIADSNHNRLVIATLDGKLLDTIGSGAIGQQDGGYVEATFNKPQGMALVGETLYVADTENHLLRRIDLGAKSVTTIAGTGEQGRNSWPGSDEFHAFSPPPERFVSTTPREFAINSPWALWVHKSDLYIAMAGSHQIWKMPLDESEIGPYAGNGREDIVDGPLLPPTPYAEGYSSFAQPSGLTSDGEWLYVADSEGSSVRAVPFDATKEAKTIVGTSHLEFGRLFEFGHRDGEGDDVRLQHCLGVAYHDGKIYVADTYNNAIKEIDVAARTCKTIAGDPPVASVAEEVDADLESPAAEPNSEDGDASDDGEATSESPDEDETGN